ncbi:hypothetical protein DMB42_11730 [Nonomuraea sp. WAC 01424]|uniref:hypothetical protein n=1 Tax=Nonomuraea sp. WAC 01424 TaxID=2203200 RepID=UPI000F7AA222|nr:hypothetical protein [Nonomuraea sp. WAC 01424]RSN12841.1 hypothetical protein DMB42_11730 [Nonomuraea sp. WAC 01424]
MATEKMSEDADSTHTPIRRFRAPDHLWEAYETVCKRVFSRERSEDIVEHMRTVIAEHGNAAELAKLELAEQELEERRARKGGRPRKTPPAGE